MSKPTFLNAKRSLNIVLLLSCIVTLTGCNKNEDLPKDSSSHTTQSSIEDKNLWNVAGQSVVPQSFTKKGYSRSLTHSEKALVGRYVVTIPCHDPVARCGDRHNGSVDFILNLASDGSVYRLIKGLGMIQVDTRKALDDDVEYDHWTEVSIHNQKYIVTSYATGMRFFYKVLSNDRLVMDINRTKLVNMQEYRQGFPFPMENYQLKKQA